MLTADHRQLNFRVRSAWCYLSIVVQTSVLVLWSLSAAAQSANLGPDAGPKRELLNSERIELQFGSYGIDVLESDSQIRVSNLYSHSDGSKVTRTFAVVGYPTNVDPQFAAEHQAILNGQSIGATFVSADWTVLKTHRYFGELAASPRVLELMGDIEAARLAVHVYVLEVVKESSRFEYATIVELHHPGYLRLSDLHDIYASEGAYLNEPDAATRRMLQIAAGRLQ